MKLCFGSHCYFQVVCFCREVQQRFDVIGLKKANLHSVHVVEIGLSADQRKEVIIGPQLA